MRGYDGNVTATCQPTFTHPDALSLPIVPRPTTAIIAVSTRKCWDELITLIINRVLIANSYRSCHYLDVDGSFVFDCFPRVGPAFPVIFFFPFFFFFSFAFPLPLSRNLDAFDGIFKPSNLKFQAVRIFMQIFVRTAWIRDSFYFSRMSRNSLNYHVKLLIYLTGKQMFVETS